MSTVKTQTTSSKGVPAGNQTFLFDKSNYTFMIAGVIVIIIGLMLMSGGKSPDSHQFNYEEIYSFRRITLAPLMILVGFAIELYAIMKKHPEQEA